MDKKTVKAIKTALIRLPKGSEALDGAYGEAVERIDSQSRGDRDLAHDVLSWLVDALRPLTTTELQHALAIELGEHVTDEDNLPFVEEMVSVCQGLVTVDNQSNIIRMVHYTTQGYFENLQMDWITNAPGHIASKCITYLSYNVFASGHCRSNEEYESRIAQNKFLVYAADHWEDHAHGIEEKVKDVAMKLLQSDALVSSVNQAKFPPDRFPFPYIGDCAPIKLHLIAFLGLHVLTRCLLDDGALPDQVNEFGYTPLHVAAIMDQEKIIELLLSHDANVNLISEDGETALHLAAQQGHEKIVERLLDHNANVNSQDGEEETPLHKAAGEGHKEVVKKLLDHNTNGNLKNNYGRTALYMAAIKGYEKIVELLLDRNADATLVNNDGKTVLQAATENGHEGVARLLEAYTLARQSSDPASPPATRHDQTC